MEYINCILCSEDNTERVYTGKDSRYNITAETFNVVRCKRCGLVYINPRPTKLEIRKYYPRNYVTREKLNNPVWLRNRLKRYKTKKNMLFLKNPWYIRLPKETNILDIGCGAGDLLIRLKELGCNTYGIDIDEITSTYLRKTFNLNVINRDVDNGIPFSSNFFDLVIMKHSLEHVHNPDKVIKEVRRIMKSDGLLFIGVPNIDSFVSRLTKEKWVDLDIPRHLFHFTPLTISILLNKNGFHIERIYHKLKVSRRSLNALIATTPLHFFLPKSFKKILGIIFSLLYKGENIVVYARKK